jgi:hypothetical protein
VCKYYTILVPFLSAFSPFSLLQYSRIAFDGMGLLFTLENIIEFDGMGLILFMLENGSAVNNGEHAW